MRLRRSVVDGPGLRRARRGRAFRFYRADGDPLTDDAVLGRIDALVIPPAWRDVWICPHANGHIQVTGIDAAGRRQYIYHRQWVDERSEEKFDRVLAMSARLPGWRERLAGDLTQRGLTRDRVLALALRLVDRGYFRAGGEEYAHDNDSFGVATLRCEHVTLRSAGVAFEYPAKSGVRRTLTITEPALVRTVRSLLRSAGRSERLLRFRAGPEWSDVRADDLNARFKQLVGDEYTVKDLRTWHATVLAATEFGCCDKPSSKAAAKRLEAAVMRTVADELGNTPAVARSAYVDPRVVAGFRNGRTIASAVHRSRRLRNHDRAQQVREAATRRLIQRG